jgi:hypothetical protein
MLSFAPSIQSHLLFAHGLSHRQIRYDVMKLTERIKETGAAGYILLWLLGIPLPILFIFFLLRGCT